MGAGGCRLPRRRVEKHEVYNLQDLGPSIVKLSDVFSLRDLELLMLSSSDARKHGVT